MACRGPGNKSDQGDKGDEVTRKARVRHLLRALSHGVSCPALCDNLPQCTVATSGYGEGGSRGGATHSVRGAQEMAGKGAPRAVCDKAQSYK